ncbi:hypothetical protein RND81_09G219000 [Saponaria officinalis]|uniref:Uncharacterized protein n=1 Tax=Saponaria officinalis TaxID=3572 RepID=A0AAW1IP25_SAPOF
MVAKIDGPMIIRFIENTEEFNKYVNDGFVTIGSDKYSDFYMAVAEGIGNTPVNVLVEEGSFMKKVYEFEITRIEREKLEEDEKMKNKIAQIEKEMKYGCLINRVNENVVDDDEKIVHVVITKKKRLRKKGSFSLLNFCACSGKQFVQD